MSTATAPVVRTGELLEVVVAQSAGTCFGVEAAIELATEKRKPILGPLVHNPQIVKELADQGIPILERYKDFDVGTVNEVIITAHGYPKQLKEELRAKGVNYHDATCPILLRWVYRHIGRFEAEGYRIILIGNPNHAEIIASRTYGTNIAVVYSEEEVDKLPEYDGKTVAICQTTITKEKFEKFVEMIRRKKYPTLKAVDTRCKPVRNQQEAVEEIAQWVDAMLILGGYNSSNTTNLAALSRKFLPDRTYHIDTPANIQADILRGIRTLGIGAGTSTPKSQIEEAKERIAEMHTGPVVFRDQPRDEDEQRVDD